MLAAWAAENNSMALMPRVLSFVGVSSGIAYSSGSSQFDSFQRPTPLPSAASDKPRSSYDGISRLDHASEANSPTESVG